MSSILDGLNEAQRQAVAAPDGPALILAGPGSGKTRVLTHRLAYLINERNIPPCKLLAVTFTNKAAKEMHRRVELILGSGSQRIRLGTFHAICALILRYEAEYLPIGRDYVIFDSSDQRTLIKAIVTDVLKLDEKRYRPELILNLISKAKNNRQTPDRMPAKIYIEEIAQHAYQLYQQQLVANNAVDFDDLLLYVVDLFEREPGVLARYQQKYAHVLVDEFQDTNLTQYDLVRQLAGKHNNLFCVGDEDQAIYGWRGADYRNLARLREDFPGLKTILLEQNYRSTQIILDAAQAIIDQNPNRTRKKLFTDQKGGPRIILNESYNEYHEAEFVLQKIAELTLQEGIDPGECAVMYRTNAQSRVLEDTFVRANLPYRLVGATRFYGRREIKDLLAYLRVIHNPHDSLSLKRIINTPPRGIGDKTLDNLFEWAKKQALSPYEALEQLATNPASSPFSTRAGNALLNFLKLLRGWQALRDDQPVGDILEMVLEETGYLAYIAEDIGQGQERIENVSQLVSVAAEFEAVGLTTFLEEVALISDPDTIEDSINAPTLLTLHAAKGLEFDAVFLVGLEEGILPHSRSVDDPEGMEEERRLFYVGITRARKYLFLTYATQRTVWGDTDSYQPSSFLDDIPDPLLDPPSRSWGGTYRQTTSWSGGPPRLDRQPEQSGPSFRIGERVYHAEFGEGIVTEIKGSGDEEIVSVSFEDVGLKRLMTGYANLERIADG